MAFSEGLSDDGTLTGRGHPTIRGLITGLMTLIGGIGHTLPFLIAIIRNRYFHTAIWMSIVQVVLGGILVFTAGILVGSG